MPIHGGTWGGYVQQQQVLIHGGKWGGYVEQLLDDECQNPRRHMGGCGTWGGTSGGKWGGDVSVWTPACMPRSLPSTRRTAYPYPPPFAAVMEQE